MRDPDWGSDSAASAELGICVCHPVHDLSVQLSGSSSKSQLLCEEGTFPWPETQASATFLDATITTQPSGQGTRVHMCCLPAMLSGLCASLLLRPPVPSDLQLCDAATGRRCFVNAQNSAPHKSRKSWREQSCGSGEHSWHERSLPMRVLRAQALVLSASWLPCVTRDVEKPGQYQGYRVIPVLKQ